MKAAASCRLPAAVSTSSALHPPATPPTAHLPLSAFPQHPPGHIFRSAPAGNTPQRPSSSLHPLTATAWAHLPPAGSKAVASAAAWRSGPSACPGQFPFPAPRTILIFHWIGTINALRSRSLRPEDLTSGSFPFTPVRRRFDIIRLSTLHPNISFDPFHSFFCGARPPHTGSGPASAPAGGPAPLPFPSHVDAPSSGLSRVSMPAGSALQGCRSVSLPECPVRKDTSSQTRCRPFNRHFLPLQMCRDRGRAVAACRSGANRSLASAATARRPPLPTGSSSITVEPKPLAGKRCLCPAPVAPLSCIWSASLAGRHGTPLPAAPVRLWTSVPPCRCSRAPCPVPVAPPASSALVQSFFQDCLPTPYSPFSCPAGRGAGPGWGDPGTLSWGEGGRSHGKGKGGEEPPQA